MERQLLTVSQFAKKHVAFSEASLRWLIFNSSKNNFSPVLRRVGRRILLDESEFFAWIDKQNGVSRGHNS